DVLFQGARVRGEVGTGRVRTVDGRRPETAFGPSWPSGTRRVHALLARVFFRVRLRRTLVNRPLRSAAPRFAKPVRFSTVGPIPNKSSPHELPTCAQSFIWGELLLGMEPTAGIEPATYALRKRCSTS